MLRKWKTPFSTGADREEGEGEREILIQYDALVPGSDKLL